MVQKQLMTSAMLQWQVGEWQKLSQIAYDDLHTDNERTRIALMVATAWLQLGERSKAKEALIWAQEFGATKEQIAEQMISSVYNTLGRARTINKDAEKAYEHFKDALMYGAAETEQSLALQLRVNEQCSQLGLSEKSEVMRSRSQLIKASAKVISQHNLGDAWAGNTVNTVIFRHHGIFTWNHFQYTTFYVNDTTLRVVQRDLRDNSIVTSDIKGTYNLKDAHNSISLGIDRLGHIHMSYDHHGTKLRYRRSTLPENISTWSDELPMTGKNEEKVTYPTFILPTNSEPLLILYRDGNWKQGNAYIKSYDEASAQWSDYEKPILSGADQKPWTSNAYWNHPVTGKDGTLHISYVWRTDYFSEKKLVSNINIGYARSYDRGQSWVTSHGHPYTLPITQVNSETIWPIAPGSNLINQTSMALDSKNHPHIVFYADDENGVPQYQHVWFDGKKWRQSYASKRTEPFVLSGGGTLQIPISRPDIVIDEYDNVFMLHRGKETQERMAATFLPAPHYGYMTENTLILHDESVGYAEPIIDRIRWDKENVLSLLLQYNEQPNGDLSHQNSLSKVTILDVAFDTQNRSVN